MFKWEKRDKKAPSKRADFVICWIKDLLDERNKQTRMSLKDKNGMCCLGVASNTAGVKWEWNDQDGQYKALYGKYVYASTLPSHIEKFLKMRDDVGSLSKEMKDKCLTYFNDEERKSFREIAKIIQEHCEGLFKGLSKKEVKYIKGFKIPSRQEMRDKKKAA